jgi:hypothetical protein
MKLLDQRPPLKQTEHRIYAAFAGWLAVLSTLALSPIPTSLASSVGSVLIAGGISAAAIWAGRYAEPGELRPPSRARTAAFTVLAAAFTAVLTLAWAHDVGGPETVAGLPFCIGLGAAMTVLTLVVGLWAVPVPVAAGLGGLVALATGGLIGEHGALVLICEFAFAGAAVGVAFASFVGRVRELAKADTSLTDRSYRDGHSYPC